MAVVTWLPRRPQARQHLSLSPCLLHIQLSDPYVYCRTERVRTGWRSSFGAINGRLRLVPLPGTTLSRQPKHTHDNKQSIALKVRSGSAYIFPRLSIYYVIQLDSIGIDTETAIRRRRDRERLFQGFPIDLLACPTGSPTAWRLSGGGGGGGSNGSETNSRCLLLRLGRLPEQPTNRSVSRYTGERQ